MFSALSSGRQARLTLPASKKGPFGTEEDLRRSGGAGEMLSRKNQGHCAKSLTQEQVGPFV